MQPWFSVSLSSWWNLWGIESLSFLHPLWGSLSCSHPFSALITCVPPHLAPLFSFFSILSTSVCHSHLSLCCLSLSQSVMESLSPEGLLADVCGWITGAESRLQAAEREGHNTCTAAELTHLLRTYQVPCCLFISINNNILAINKWNRWSWVEILF